jgi:hypothetical protein
MYLKALVGLLQFGLVSHESDNLLIRGIPKPVRVGIGEIEVRPWVRVSPETMAPLRRRSLAAARGIILPLEDMRL